MARFGMFGLGRRGPRDEQQQAGRRLVRRGMLALAAAATVLAVGLVGMQGASANGPMTVSGYTTDFLYGTRTLSVSVGGAACANESLTNASYFSLSLPASCGSPGAAVTFATNGVAEGVKTQQGATCLQFAPGTTVDELTVVAGGTPDTSCGGKAGPTPSPSPSASPAASPLVLTPNGTWYNYQDHHDEEDAFYCFYTNGYGPDLSASFPQIAVGYEHYNDPGTQPFPCWQWTDTYYRGAVQFDWDQVNSYAQAHGIKSATLTYSAGQGDVGCVSEVQEASDDLNSFDFNSGPIPGGQSLTPAPVVSGGTAKVDLAGMIAFGEIWGGIDAHMHFVFIGKNESLSAQDNDTCHALLDNFKLTIVADH